MYNIFVHVFIAKNTLFYFCHAILIGAIRMRNAYFGEGSGPVLLTDVYCSSPKDSLMNCSIRYTSRVSNRNRNLVVGVKCQRM